MSQRTPALRTLHLHDTLYQPGIVDSLAWVKASVDSNEENAYCLHKKSSAVLRNAVDEEGTPLLQLAISLVAPPRSLILIM
jgi:hypothetical protein